MLSWWCNRLILWMDAIMKSLQPPALVRRSSSLCRERYIICQLPPGFLHHCLLVGWSLVQAQHQTFINIMYAKKKRKKHRPVATYWLVPVLYHFTCTSPSSLPHVTHAQSGVNCVCLYTTKCLLNTSITYLFGL